MTPHLMEAYFHIDGEMVEYLDFDSNGLGVLSDAARCTVTEKRNDAYTLEMEYPVGGAHWDKLTVGRILIAKPNMLDRPQPFTIVKVTRSIWGTVRVSAEHISYRLNGILCSRILARTLGELLQQISQRSYDNPFLFHTDTPGVGTTVGMSGFDTDIPRSVRSIFGEGDNCILKKFPAYEFHYDRFQVDVLLARGMNPVVPLRYGGNITSLSQECNVRDLVTDYYPYYRKDDVYLELDEPILHEKFGSFATVERAEAVDLTDTFAEDEAVNQTTLRAHAEAYIAANRQEAIPENLRISFVELGKTVEYQGTVPAQPFGLCDWVQVDYPEFGISKQMKVIATVYDVLNDCYQSIEIGTPNETLSETLRKVK